MKNNPITLFRADLLKNNVGTEEQRQSLIQEILSIKDKNSEGILKSNIDCWRYNNPCKNIDWLMKEILDLLDQMIEFYESKDKIFKSTTKSKIVKVDYWANVNEPGSRNSIHAHKPSEFSAVYYLQSKNTGTIRFINPSNIMSDCNPGSPFTADIAIEPLDGDLIIWPSWVPHEVETNFSNIQRINLAFDIRVTE